MSGALAPPGAEDEAAIRALYARLLDGWNRRSGEAFAAAFVEDGEVVGFDGSQHTGRAGIAGDLTRVLTDHVTPSAATG